MSKPPTHSPIASPSSHGSGAAASTGRQPAADRRHRHRQPEEGLRVGGVALRQRIPEHDGQRHRRQPAAERAHLERHRDEHDRPHDDEQRWPRVVDIAPRGSSRIAVRGFSASQRASTRRLKPIAALRAATIADDDPAPPAARSIGVLTRGQQRPGQRKRQREHRVAEADERQIRGQAGHVRSQEVSGSLPTTRRRRRCQTPGALPRPPDRPGSDTATISACLPGEQGAEAGDPAPARALRRASRSRGSGGPAPPGASQRIAFSSANRFRSLTRARLSVPTATGTPEGRTARLAGRPTPTHWLLRGHVTRVAPRSCSRARLSLTELHAVHDERARVDHTQVIQVLAPDRARRHPVVAPGADAPSSCAPRAGAVDASSSTSSGDSPTWMLVMGSALLVDVVADRPEQLARDRVRRVRSQRRCGPRTARRGFRADGPRAFDQRAASSP